MKSIERSSAGKKGGWFGSMSRAFDGGRKGDKSVAGEAIAQAGR